MEPRKQLILTWFCIWYCIILDTGEHTIQHIFYCKLQGAFGGRITQVKNRRPTERQNVFGQKQLVFLPTSSMSSESIDSTSTTSTFPSTPRFFSMGIPGMLHKENKRNCSLGVARKLILVCCVTIDWKQITISKITLWCSEKHISFQRTSKICRNISK